MRVSVRVGIALGVAVAAVYAATAPAWLLGGDSAEFVTVMAAGGIAHAPGYPLYVLWLRVLHALFGFVSPPHLAALATVPFGAGAAVLLYATALRQQATLGAAVFGALLFAFSPLAWRLGSQPEVFAPHVFLCALLVYLSVGPLTGPARVAAVSFVGGLALSVHHTAVLVGPAVVYGLVAGGREMDRRWRVPFLMVLGGGLGLLPYLSLPLSWPELARYFLRSEYGTFQLSAVNEGLHPLVQLQAFVTRVGRELLFLPILLVGGGWWIASFLLAGPVFVSLLNIAPYGTGQLFVPRFYLLPMWLLCLGIALGARRVRYIWPLALLQLAFSWNSVQAELRPTLDDWMHNAMRVLPDGAVVLADGDNRVFALEYAVRVEHLNAEVVRAVRADPEAIIAQEQRPVFLTLGTAVSLMGKVPMVPHIPFFRVGKASLEEVTRKNHELFAGFRLDRSEDREQTWGNLIMLDYSEAWIWLARRWKKAGDETQVLGCLEEVSKLGDWFVEAAVEKTASPSR